MVNKGALRKLNKAINRRRFLQASGIAAGVASMNLTFAPNAFSAPAQQKTLVYVFLRGGIDGLSLLPPIDGADYGHYLDARDRTLIDINSANADRRPIPLTNGAGLGMHPYCQGLADIFHENKMAIVQAAGHPPGTFTRSHFDAQEQIELGQPLIDSGMGPGAPSTGWLARYLQTAPGVPAANAIFTAMVSNSTPPTSLGGWPDVATLDSPNGFTPNRGRFGDTQRAVLKNLYGGASELDIATGAALDAIDLINSIDFDNYQPDGGAVYPDNREGRNFKLAAQLIRQDLGIACATIDVGGWDTHNDQNVFGNNFGNNVRDLNDALTAFYRDLEGAGIIDDVAIVVQSEFGRQVKENASHGTDHGLGNPMLVLGSSVKGGQIYGQSLGLHPNDREGDSLIPQTDFRQVLGETAAGLLGNTNVDDIFIDNSFVYQPVGFAT